jgi:hypothetical protein
MYFIHASITTVQFPRYKQIILAPKIPIITIQQTTPLSQSNIKKPNDVTSSLPQSNHPQPISAIPDDPRAQNTKIGFDDVIRSCASLTLHHHGFAACGKQIRNPCSKMRRSGLWQAGNTLSQGASAFCLLQAHDSPTPVPTETKKLVAVPTRQFTLELDN